MTLKVKVNDFKSMTSYRTNKPNFLEYWVKMAKMTLKVKVNYLHFRYQPRVSQDACLVPNLVILAQIYDELTRRQAVFTRILSQNCQNDLEGQGHWPLFSKPTESIPWYMFGANLVIPTQIYDELSCGQGKVYGRLDRRRQWQYPFGLKGQGVKMVAKLQKTIFRTISSIKAGQFWYLFFIEVCLLTVWYKTKFGSQNFG